MDEKDALDLARQLREHLQYQGDVEQFDQEIVALVAHVVNECAKVVEDMPIQAFLMFKQPEALLSYMAYCIRGKDKR